MFGFISSFFQKAATLLTSVLVAVGLVSAPIAPAPVVEPVSEPVVNEAATAILADQLTEPEKPAVKEPEKVTSKKVAPKPAPAPAPVLPPPPAVPKTQKLILPNGTVVEVDASGNVISSGGVPQPAPTLTPATAPSPTPPPAGGSAPLPPGHFRLPSGIIVDQNGNIVN